MLNDYLLKIKKYEELTQFVEFLSHLQKKKKVRDGLVTEFENFLLQNFDNISSIFAEMYFVPYQTLMIVLSFENR